MTSLNKICLHWTAGTYNPCNVDLKAYHYLINKDGWIFEGTHKPEDNINCYDGNYAAHCGGGNTGCIGISVCGMADFDMKNKKTKYPITKKQIEAMACLSAYLSIKYGFLITEKTCFTHHEFDQKRPEKKRENKIDIEYLPFLPNLQPISVGNYIRHSAEWYRVKINQGKYKFEKKGNHYEFINIL